MAAFFVAAPLRGTLGGRMQRRPGRYTAAIMRESLATARVVSNFGGNVVSRPRAVATPRSEAEVLATLQQYRGRNIRALGRLHSWSDAARADDVLLDLRHLSGVEVTSDANGPLAKVGAGCQIKRLLSELARHGLTMPALGLISEQTIAGATATGTHGSGRHSLSHYLCEIRVAHYDPASSEPVIRVICEGDELRAARCSLGSLGIVVSVALRPRPAYRIEEWLARHESLDAVLSAESDTPLQQFFVIPWLWTYVVQHRRETARPRSSLAGLYRAYWFLTMDLGLHLVLRFLVQMLASDRLVRWFYRRAALLTVVRGWHVVDDSAATLVMEHELFRHIEIELFVKRGELNAAVGYLRELIEHCAGNAAAITVGTRDKLRAHDLDRDLDALLSTYVHHYAICIRKVLPDDTLISMTAGDDQPRYALSLISYARPQRRASFFGFALFAARSLAALFGARPHWGKVCPLDAAELSRLFPQLTTFRAIGRQFDPAGVFRNEWISSILNFETLEASARADEPAGQPAPRQIRDDDRMTPAE